MIKHIVMWKIKGDTGHGSKEEVMEKMKIELEGLKEKIEDIVEIEVGINFEPSEMAYDVVLYSVFKNQEGLERYQKHPAHQRVANELVRQVSGGRVVVDYLI
ncbi:MAG TPA: Dabb family protein [Epulopiscium sp.]|nr:Dabb family protein [Candidatus Epulonipiscium sp.]